MKTKEISYRRVFSLGDYQTETYGVTIEMIESTDVQEAIELARREIEEAHAKVMSERAKPERVEKVVAVDRRIEITASRLDTILSAIRNGKADEKYIESNFKTTNDSFIKQISEALNNNK